MYNAVLIGKDQWVVGVLENHTFRALNSDEVVDVCNKLNDFEDKVYRHPKKVIYAHVVCNEANQVDKNGRMYTEESLRKADGRKIPLRSVDGEKIIGETELKYDQQTKSLMGIVTINKKNESEQ